MILPVRNREETLSARIAQALEVLPELTPRWELLIVDDGSTDATPEVIQDLVRLYPQVNVMHHTAPRGDVACLHGAVQRARGDILLLRAEACDLDLAGLPAMWAQIGTHDLVVARSRRDETVGVAPTRPSRRGKPKSTAAPTLQMIRRGAIEGWITSRDPQDLHGYLTAKGYPQHEVELRRDLLASLSTSYGGTARAHDRGPGVQPRHCDQGDVEGRPRRPNYLLRLKAFALGE